MFRIKDTTDNNHLNSFYGRTSRKTNLWAKQIRKKRPGLFADCFLLLSLPLRRGTIVANDGQFTYDCLVVIVIIIIFVVIVLLYHHQKTMLNRECHFVCT